MKIAIITGASSGFGKEFVYQIEQDYIKRGTPLDEIWVVARRKERLEELQKELKTKVVPLALDLCKKESITEIKSLLEEKKPTILCMVNSSGFGFFSKVMDRSLDDWMRLIDLNDKALVSLCYIAIPYMVKGSEIYNIASSSAFQPVPYISIYGASKSFVLNFSRAFNKELLKEGIKVMAVVPHWTKTEFFDTAIKEKDVIVYYNVFNLTKDVVSTAIKNMKKGKDVSVVGFKVKFQLFLVKHLPHSFVMKTWLKQQKKQYK